MEADTVKVGHYSLRWPQGPRWPIFNTETTKTPDYV